jgi:DnaA family protein
MLQLDLLDLGIKPVVKHTFENYIASEYNQQIIAHLNYLIKQPENAYLYLWGSSKVGKSHLLQAVCEAATNKNLSASYFSFNWLKNNNNLLDLANILDNLELQDIICLDDLDILANNSDAEELLFGFYNKIKDANKVLIIASKCSVNTQRI